MDGNGVRRLIGSCSVEALALVYLMALVYLKGHAAGHMIPLNLHFKLHLISRDCAKTGVVYQIECLSCYALYISEILRAPMHE